MEWLYRCCRQDACTRTNTYDPDQVVTTHPNISGMDSTNSSSNPESWIVLNHDYSWEEVVLNGMDGWFIDDDIPQLAALPAAARPFDAARLSDVCRGFRSSLERMDSHLQVAHPSISLKSPRLRFPHPPFIAGIRRDARPRRQTSWPPAGVREREWLG